ncbi:MAG: hypothetical protein LBU43_10155 [Candidatus Accumulibacter sp.]|nr:hypothetical protein [Accumulibacter sp.]
MNNHHFRVERGGFTRQTFSKKSAALRAAFRQRQGFKPNWLYHEIPL